MIFYSFHSFDPFDGTDRTDGTGQKLRPFGHLDGGRPGSDPADRLVKQRLPGYQRFMKKDDLWPFAISAAYVHSSCYLKIGKKSTAAHLSKVPLFCLLSSSRLLHKVSKVISSRIHIRRRRGRRREIPGRYQSMLMYIMRHGNYIRTSHLRGHYSDLFLPAATYLSSSRLGTFLAAK